MYNKDILIPYKKLPASLLNPRSYVIQLIIPNLQNQYAGGSGEIFE